MVLLGASLGGAVAIDFAHYHPERVSKLILVDAQGFIDGIGPMSKMPTAVANVGVSVLRSEWLRNAANKMSYYAPETFATEDAMRVGRVHTFLPGWRDANVAWMQSGGYSTSKMVPTLQPETTMIVWGAQDKVLEPKYADMFREALPAARVELVDECGHVCHLEQPDVLVGLVQSFLV
jgi:pimeloyl-ACP methyl ester carboxylesterase